MSNKKWKGKICKKSNHKIGEFCLIEKEKKRGEWLTSYLNKTNTQIKRERERGKGKKMRVKPPVTPASANSGFFAC